MKIFNSYKMAVNSIRKTSGSIGLLTIAVVGIFSLPAQAGGYRTSGDSAVIQSSEQRAVITGDSNNVQQNSSQTHIERGRPGYGNQGVVQEQVQDADVYGRHNQVRQTNRQTSVENHMPNVTPTYHPPAQKKPAPPAYQKKPAPKKH